VNARASCGYWEADPMLFNQQCPVILVEHNFYTLAEIFMATYCTSNVNPQTSENMIKLIVIHYNG
jgi:hypothetical protein